MTVSAPSPNLAPASRNARLGTRAMSVAVLTFVLGAAASIAIAHRAYEQARNAAHERFALRADHVTASLQQHLYDAAAVVRSARGFVAASFPPSDDAWRRYVGQLELDDLQSPVRTLGTLDARAHQTSDAAPFAALVDDAATRDALQRATDTGQLALAARPVPHDAGGMHNRQAFTLYVPVYASGGAHRDANGSRNVDATAHERRAATAGFVYATLDPRRFLEFANSAGIELQIAAGNPAALIYATGSPSAGPRDGGATWRKTDTLTFGGETLSLAYAAADNTALPPNAIAALAAGFAASAAAAVIAYRLARRRSAAPAQRPDGTLDEARMMGIIRSSMEAIITIDETQTIVIFNPAAERVFGVSAMDAIGAPLSRFIPERFRAAHAKHVEQFGVTGVSDRQMGRQRVLFGLRGNGEEFPIEASISQIRDGSGKLYTVMLRDVTERVRADNALKQSREELRRLSANLQNVREEEKTRIARELHDDLGQQLTALKMDLSAVELALGSASAAADTQSAPPASGQPGADVRGQLRGMHRLIDSTVASVRRIAADLRPVMLDDLGLVPAIEWLATDFTNRYGIEVERRIALADIALTNAGATTLFRIVQEALTNVARHADATQVALTLKIDDGHCVLRIADNGQGARGGTREGQSFGLIGIRERAHMLDGTVTIDSTPGQGFTITVALPLHAIQQSESLS
nr:PAS domain S-box protein [Burkholderia singularis]